MGNRFCGPGSSMLLTSPSTDRLLVVILYTLLRLRSLSNCARLSTPLLPAFSQVDLVGIDETCSRLARTGIWNISTIKPLPNGSWSHPHESRNLNAFHPLLLQCHDLLVTSCSFRLTSLLRPFRSRVSWDDCGAEVEVAALGWRWPLPAQHDAVASGFGSVALRHRRLDSSPNASGHSPVELGEPLS